MNTSQDPHAPLSPEELAAAAEFERKYAIGGHRVGDPLPPKPRKPGEIIIRGFAHRRRVTVISGEGGTGKSILTHQGALCICMGKAFVGEEVQEAGDVFLIDNELEEAELLDLETGRIPALARSEGIPLPIPGFIVDARLDKECTEEGEGSEELAPDVMPANLTETGRKKITLDTFERYLLASLKKHGILETCNCVILDAGSQFYCGAIDECAYDEVRQLIRGFKKLAKRYNLAIIILLHVAKNVAGHWKNASARGSASFQDTPDFAFTLTKKGEPVGDRVQAELTCIKSRTGGWWKRRTLERDGLEFWHVKPDAEEDAAKLEAKGANGAKGTRTREMDWVGLFATGKEEFRASVKKVGLYDLYRAHTFNGTKADAIAALKAACAPGGPLKKKGKGKATRYILSADGQGEWNRRRAAEAPGGAVAE